MKKIFSVLMCTVMVGALSIGVTGCDSKPKETMAEFGAIPDLKIGKKEEKEVSVEIKKKADVDINLNGTVKDGDKITIVGGTIKKGETKVNLKVKTDDSKAGPYDVTVTASGTNVKGSTTFKVEVLK